MTANRSVVRALRTEELAALAERFAEDVRAGCYEIQADASQRWHVRIHQDELVDVWLISWTESQRTELHDHGDSRGVFTVVEGTLTEAVWDGSALTEHAVESGETVSFESAYVHDVYNEASEVAVSVHAYSPPLSRMSYYDVQDGDLMALATTWTDDPETPAPTYASVDELLASARDGLPRLTPVDAKAAIDEGALLVDIRPEWQRRRDGEVPGSVIVERNHLEWRLHPASEARIEQAVAGQRWVVICAEGYTSSLAAASLNSLGVPAADVIGGIAAWAEAGLPVVAGATAVEHVVQRSA
ncbi:MAG: rhodanese-like domain-containing protein [Marmoricola sp.]